MDRSITDLKIILDEKEGRQFYFKWKTEQTFISSLNFSFGSTIFDTNYPNTESDVIAFGCLYAITDSTTEIVLTNKSKYGSTFLLFVPLLMLIVDISFKLRIPIPFYLIFPAGYLFIIHLLLKEERRLLKDFKNFLH